MSTPLTVALVLLALATAREHSFEAAAADAPNPTPALGAVASQHGIRVTVLSSGLMRVQWQRSSTPSGTASTTASATGRAAPQDGTRQHAPGPLDDDRPTLQVVNRRVLPVPVFTTSHGTASLHVATATIALSATLSSSRSTGSTYAGSTGAQGHTHDREDSRARLGDGTQDLTTRFTCSHESGPPRTHEVSFSATFPKNSSPLVPPFPAMINAAGMYAMYDGATHRTTAADDSEEPWLDKATQQPENLDLYFFCYGSDYTLGLTQLASITGPAPLMPQAAYGVWWCQCCPAYTAQSFEQEILAFYNNHSLPLTIVVLDMDWHVGGSSPVGGGLLWNSYTWDKTLFANHTDFVARLKSGDTPYQKPLKLVLNIHPGSYQIYNGPARPPEHSDEEHYAAFSKAMGVDPALNKTFNCNLYDQTYTNAVTSTMLDATGMDYYWDDCYSCTWESGINRTLNAYGDGGSCGDGVSTNVEANLWSNLAFNNHRQRITKERPLTLNRLPGVSPSNVHTTLLTNPTLTATSALGGHRYPAAWTGDVSGSWDSLQAHVALFPAASANLLYPFYSADLGGFQPASSLTPERYVRWLQWAVWMPIFRTHGSGSNDKRIWSPRFTTVYKELADAVRMRGAIIPWIYTLAHQNHALSAPFIRPMWFNWPSLPGAPAQPQPLAAHAHAHAHAHPATSGQTGPGAEPNISQQFMFGEALVHPITTEIISRKHETGDSNCTARPVAREECGYPGITQAQCLACSVHGKDPSRCKASGCCWLQSTLRDGNAARRTTDTYSDDNNNVGTSVGGGRNSANVSVHGVPWCYFSGMGPKTPGNATVRVTSFLPARNDGKAWVRLDGTVPTNTTRSVVQGQEGLSVTEDFMLGEIPVYVPQASVFPLQTLNSTTKPFSDPLIWAVVAATLLPHTSSPGSVVKGGFDLYEDDGRTLVYKTPSNRSHAFTNASFECSQPLPLPGRGSAGALTLTFTANATAGGFDGMPSSRQHWMQLRPAPKAPAESKSNKFVCRPGTKHEYVLSLLPAGAPGRAGFWWVCGTHVEASMTCSDGALVLACPASPNSAATVITAQYPQ